MFNKISFNSNIMLRTHLCSSLTRGIHEAAVKGFTANNVASYEMGRPDYNGVAMNTVLDILKSCNKQNSYPFFVELGAGTGKFTKSLYPLLSPNWNDFFKLVVAEPMPGFNNYLKETVSNFRNVTIVSDSATNVSVKSESINGVLAAQAFHWFANDETMIEMSRILMTGMPMIFIWNTFDYRIPLMKDLDQLYIFPYYQSSVPRQQSKQWERVFDAGRPASRLFTPINRSLNYIKMEYSADMVVQRVLSTSVIAELPQAKKDQINNDVLNFLRTHPDSRNIDPAGLYPMQYETEVVWFNKL